METLQARTEMGVSEQFDRYLRAYDDASTWLAEVLDGSMRTCFEYRFDGRELYARDGGRLGPVFENALQDAEKLGHARPNLLFEWRRRRIEYEEYQEMIQMAHGELPNTMVVVSDFPPELMDCPHDVGGYNVTRKQTMLRVLTRQPDGGVKMYSQSLDRSDRSALESIYAQFGIDPEPGELLGQRIHADVAAEDQDGLVDYLTGVYDRSLKQRYGGEYYAGRSNESRQSTYDFVRRQDDLLELLVDSHTPGAAAGSHLLYGVAAAMEARFESQTRISGRELTNPAAFVSPRDLQLEIRLASRAAQVSGKSYSGCGATLSLGPQAGGAGEQLAEAGYGNQTDKSDVYTFSKKMHCVVCQAPPKKGEARKMCGPCGICRSCDLKLRSK